jgi:uncharacterized metal-binding protein
MAPRKKCLSCTDCAINTCNKTGDNFPEFCLTTKLEDAEVEEVLNLYKNDEQVRKLAISGAEVEGGFYGKYTRVEEIMEFARRIGAKKIGIATCIGLIEESRIFARILRTKGFEPYGVACKVAAVDKTEIGIGDEYIRREHEHICNPILQAKLLNKQKTELNVVVGLCVGHDSLFYRYSEAPTTTLVTKDRMTGHNPIAALYTAHSYYGKLLKKD